MPNCSFCNKDNVKDNMTLISGNKAYICTECINVCYEMINDKNIETKTKTKPKAKPKAKAKTDMDKSTTKLATADKFTYIVFAKVVDDFGYQVMGAGSVPIYIFENSDSGEAFALFGSEDIKKATTILTTGAGRADVISSYLNFSGLADFNSTTSMDVENSFVTELISAAIDKDGGDFEYENNLSLTILEGQEATNDEDMLSTLEGKFGVWVMSRENLDISFNESAKKLNINGQDFSDLGGAINDLLMSDFDEQIVTIIN